MPSASSTNFSWQRRAGACRIDRSGRKAGFANPLVASRRRCAGGRDDTAPVRGARRAGPARTHLAVVPIPEQPELPIPSPNASSPPAIALVRSETELAELAFVEASPEQASLVRISRRRAKKSASTQARHRPAHCHRSYRCLKTNGLLCLREAFHAAIRRSNISTSTLPPDKIPTTILLSTSIFPASNAARPMTPPGSTTSLSSLNA
jgi:hypothetical protein